MKHTLGSTLFKYGVTNEDLELLAVKQYFRCELSQAKCAEVELHM